MKAMEVLGWLLVTELSPIANVPSVCRHPVSGTTETQNGHTYRSCWPTAARCRSCFRPTKNDLRWCESALERCHTHRYRRADPSRNRRYLRLRSSHEFRCRCDCRRSDRYIVARDHPRSRLCSRYQILGTPCGMWRRLELRKRYRVRLRWSSRICPSRKDYYLRNGDEPRRFHLCKAR